MSALEKLSALVITSLLSCNTNDRGATNTEAEKPQDSGDSLAASCSVFKDRDGIMKVSCTDGFIAPLNVNGQACKISIESSESQTISCPDGTSLTVPKDKHCTVTEAEGAKEVVCSDGSAVTVEDTSSCSLNANEDGTTTVTCEEGGSATLANRAALSKFQILGPGQFVDIDHDFTSAVPIAKYLENGLARDVSDFGALHSPIIGTPVKSFSTVGGLGRVRGEKLANGNVLLVQSRARFSIIDPAGNEIVPTTTLDGNAQQHSYAVIKSGGFLVSYNSSSARSRLNIRKFDDLGNEVGFENGTILARTIDGYKSSGGQRHVLAALEDGSFAVAYINTDDQRVLARFDREGIDKGVTFKEAVGDSNSCCYMGLKTLDKNRLLWIFNKTVASPEEAAFFGVYDDFGVELSSSQLAGDNVASRIDMPQAPNGNFIAAFELSSSNLLAYATFDKTGRQLTRTRELSVSEFDDLSAGVYGDGDFVVAMTDEGSNAAMMWNISNAGTLKTADPIIFGDGFVPLRSWATITKSPHSVYMAYEVYGHPESYLVEISKNELPIKVISPTKVRLSNHTGRATAVLFSLVGQ